MNDDLTIKYKNYTGILSWAPPSGDKPGCWIVSCKSTNDVGNITHIFTSAPHCDWQLTEAFCNAIDRYERERQCQQNT